MEVIEYTKEEMWDDLEQKPYWIREGDTEEFSRCLETYGSDFVDELDLIEAAVAGKDEVVGLLLPHIDADDLFGLLDEDYQGVMDWKKAEQGLCNADAMEVSSRMLIEAYYGQLSLEQSIPQARASLEPPVLSQGVSEGQEGVDPAPIKPRKQRL